MLSKLPVADDLRKPLMCSGKGTPHVVRYNERPKSALARYVPLPNPSTPAILNSVMNNRIWVIILVLVCVGLGVSVVTIRNKAAENQRHDAEMIGTYSNKWVKSSSDLDE